MIAIGLLLAIDLTRGIALYRDQKFVLAEQEFRRAIKLQPSESRARLYLARTLIEVRRVPEALEELKRVLGTKATPETRFEAGRILRELAEDRFKELSAAAPESAPVRELAGERYEWMGDLSAALSEYRAAAALNPNRPGVHYRIGNILWRQRELDKAYQELSKEIALTPHHGMANLRMGQILLAQDKSESAVPFLARASEAMAGAVEARRELGKAYRNLGRNAEARVEWEAVAKLKPQDNQIHYLLGNLYRELGEAELAKQELARHKEILQKRQAR